MQRRVFCVTLASTTTSLISSGTCTALNPVSTCRACFLLSQPQGAFVSRWRSPLDWWSGITASTTVRFLPTPDRSSNSAQHHWRSIISCDCRTSMEQSSYQRQCINFSTVFQETTWNIFIYQILPMTLSCFLIFVYRVLEATYDLYHVVRFIPR